MPGAITPHDPPSAGTGKADQQAAKPRRNKVQEVVCASGSPAEGAPPFLPVADHAVSCLNRSEEHTSVLQSLLRLSYAVFCLQKKNRFTTKQSQTTLQNTCATQRQISTQSFHTFP